jgi:hypothetical protein
MCVCRKVCVYACINLPQHPWDSQFCVINILQYLPIFTCTILRQYKISLPHCTPIPPYLSHLIRPWRQVCETLVEDIRPVRAGLRCRRHGSQLWLRLLDLQRDVKAAVGHKLWG